MSKFGYEAVSMVAMLLILGAVGCGMFGAAGFGGLLLATSCVLMFWGIFNRVCLGDK